METLPPAIPSSIAGIAGIAGVVHSDPNDRNDYMETRLKGWCNRSSKHSYDGGVMEIVPFLENDF